MKPVLLPGTEDRRALTAFLFWSSWAAATDRPGECGLSYTSNWPHEPLVGNTLTTGSAMWSIASIVLLIAGIAGMVWYHTAHKQEVFAAGGVLLAAYALKLLRRPRIGEAQPVGVLQGAD